MGVTVSDTGQRSNGIGLGFDNSLATSKPLEQSVHKGLGWQRCEAWLAQISWKNGTVREVAASELSWFVSKRWDPRPGKRLVLQKKGIRVAGAAVGVSE